MATRPVREQVRRSKAAAIVSRLVREATDNGAAIVLAVVQIAAGKHESIKSERSRLWALEWLADRAFGKAVQPLDIDLATGSESAPDISMLTSDERAVFARLTGKIAEANRAQCAAQLRELPLAELREMAVEDGEAPELPDLRDKTLDELREMAVRPPD